MQPESTQLNKAMSMLGIARRAGRLAGGTPAVCDALKRGGVHLVVFPEGIAANTEKRLRDRCAYYKVPIRQLPLSQDAFSHALGYGQISGAAVTDQGLADTVLAALDGSAANA